MTMLASKDNVYHQSLKRDNRNVAMNVDNNVIQLIP